MEKRFPRILIAGTNSGCGKTTTVCAILQSLKNRALSVASFKCGPDYIDPMFHSRVIGTKSRNLDLHMFTENTLRYLLQKNAADCDISVIEGVMGYYDGVGLGTEASSYAVAKASATPTVLVVNAKGAAHSLLATISGFANLKADSGIRAVIFNNCSPMLYPMLADAVKAQFGGRILPLGFLPPMPDCRLESRHLGLITADEVENLHAMLQALAAQAEKTIDLDGLLSLASSAPALTWTPPDLPEKGEGVRIAIAMDKAFCFYYEDSLTLLRELGAELVPFSPLEDAHLPEGIDGLYLGGGYPELYPELLEQNASMRRDIRAYLEKGKPCIAECGGFLYLHEKLCGHEMVGYFKGSGTDQKKLVRFGYVTLRAQKDNVFCKAGETLRAHEFHYYDVPDPGDGFIATKSTGRSWKSAVTSPTLYAGFPHFNFYAEPNMAQRFLTVCREEKHKHD